MAVLVARNVTSGHRAEYLAVVETALKESGQTVLVRSDGAALIFTRDVVFFMMIEESSTRFFLLAVLRALFGRRTAGLLFRPSECVAPRKFRLVLKRLGLQMLKLLPGSAVVTILPFSLNPEFERIARFGIYDIQLWDLYDSPSFGKVLKPTGELNAEIDRAAGGRKVMVALGSQNLEKGFNYFCDVWNAPAGEDLRRQFLFVSAGEVAGSCKVFARQFAAQGGFLIDRPMRDDELAALYRRADLVWCCYAPFYDQSSGIFGRAVQYGKPAAARRGSYLARLAQEAGHPILELDWADPSSAQRSLLGGKLDPRDPESVRRAVAEMKEFSLARLGEAIGIALQPSTVPALTQRALGPVQ
jgi:hypothetical protein